MKPEKITSFEQLFSWQKAATLAVKVYALTNQFPSAEKFALTDQVQRSAVSVSANIAEGFGRTSKAEKMQFYTIAYGSLLETKSHLLIAHKLQYVSAPEIEEVSSLITDLQKLINASKKALQ